MKTDDEWISEWLSDEDFDFLFDFLGGMATPSRRKCRLFALACCRSIWELLTSREWRSSIESVEKVVDTPAAFEELQRIFESATAAANAAWELHNHQAYRFPGLVRHVARPEMDEIGAKDTQAHAIGIVMEHWGWSLGDSEAEGAVDQEHDRQIKVFRDVFGNPFRPTTIDPAWLVWNDSTIPKLAQAIYDDRQLPSGHLDAGRLAILADALEEAGCTNADILSHCRPPGPHVRGCWVVDLILGKK